MKLAKAPQAEIDRLMRWLQAREKSDDPPPPFMRVVFGYETLLNNCADPAADTLEFKPELLAAKEDSARLGWALDHPVQFERIIGDLKWGPDAAKNLTHARAALDAARA